ncbi:MAG: hypothetical protein OEX22_05490 [Cyclobacteriaceae bacterium]|nr:hypothetical protein [Cyclobacteriaceae bacterium]
MKSKTLIVFIALFTFLVSLGFGQSDVEIDERSSFRDRLFTGGGVGAGFGTFTWVQLAPVVGYRITNEFSAGIGVQYRYSSYKQFTPKITTNDYGANLFARYNIRTPFFAQVEYEYLDYEFIDAADFSKIRKGNTAFLVGGGMSQPMGGKAFFNLTALYNLLYSPGGAFNPYSSPWVLRAGVSLGF